MQTIIRKDNKNKRYLMNDSTFGSHLNCLTCKRIENRGKIDFRNDFVFYLFKRQRPLFHIIVKTFFILKNVYMSQ